MQTIEMSEVSEVMQPGWGSRDTPQVGGFSVKSNFAYAGQSRMTLKPFKQGLLER